METKKELRMKHKKLRDAMTAEHKSFLSQKICNRILTSEIYRHARVVYSYYPLGSEVSLFPVMENCLLQNKILALPRVEGCMMEFFRITDLSQVKEGSFHVMEPITGEKLQEEQALVLTPGLVFDRIGSRIGYGKGYYDRYFEHYPRLVRMGAAYECQVESIFSPDSNDIYLNYLVTEKEMICFYAEFVKI